MFDCRKRSTEIGKGSKSWFLKEQATCGVNQVSARLVLCSCCRRPFFHEREYTCYLVLIRLDSVLICSEIKGHLSRKAVPILSIKILGFGSHRARRLFVTSYASNRRRRRARWRIWRWWWWLGKNASCMRVATRCRCMFVDDIRGSRSPSVLIWASSCLFCFLLHLVRKPKSVSRAIIWRPAVLPFHK